MAGPFAGTIRNALFLSDIHLGWSICQASHERLLERLPEAVDDAELIVLNGDIVDRHRGAGRVYALEHARRLFELITGWRREGRQVVYVEGNHDPIERAEGELRPDCWFHDFGTSDGRRVRVLHGHRFTKAPYQPDAYEGLGRHFLALENRLYELAPFRKLYRLGPGWLVGAIGRLEDRLWRPRFPALVGPLLEDVDVLIHGHFHFGPGQGRIGRVRTWKSGAWASFGHLGSVDRVLRLRDGLFERLELVGGRWRASGDGL